MLLMFSGLRRVLVGRTFFGKLPPCSSENRTTELGSLGSKEAAIGIEERQKNFSDLAERMDLRDATKQN